ncbi:phage terminase small subunit [Bordetella bronchialis]|uniref:phage terminase small subunit n=1 Tax=Bordetella bronchialis TaxID=463025 RepID=UPI003D02A37A
MASLAQQHRMRVLAARGAVTQDGTRPAGGVHALMMASLLQDMRRLKAIESVERKIAAKAQMLPAYRDYVDGVLAADAGGADEVITTLMVWHLDVGDFGRGLDLAAYVLRHGLTLPERYNRKVPALLLDEVADAVLEGRAPADEATLDALQRVAVLTDGQDAPDQARAKLHRALGETLARLAGEAPAGPKLEMARAALAQLNRAVSLNPGVGAKKAIEQLTRTIKKAEANADG